MLIGCFEYSRRNAKIAKIEQLKWLINGSEMALSLHVPRTVGMIWR